MTGERLFELLSDLPDDLIAQADQPPRRKISPLTRWGPLAACACVALLVGILALLPRQTKQATSDAAAPAASESAGAIAPTAPTAPPASEDAPATDAVPGNDDFGVGGIGTPETAPAEPAETPPSDGLLGTDSGSQAAPGFWNPYSLDSEAITLYVPGPTGWTATTITDGFSIKGIYTRLFICDPQPLSALTEEAVSVLVDLQNGFAFTLHTGAAGEATLYTVPDGEALTAALTRGEDPWPHLTVTDPAVVYDPDLDAFIATLLPQ